MSAQNLTVTIPRWGELNISLEEKTIITHPAFQRLRNIRQLGLSYLHFPQAKVRRYEHCIAVGYLAGLAAKAIQKKQPELKVSDRDILLTKLGGLCHDIGHGPFSHVFDVFLEKCPKQIPIVRRHEERSRIIVEWLFSQYPELFSKRDIQAVQAVIDPKYVKKPSDFPTFLTEIVSNDNHGIDVDRLEYISGDSQLFFTEKKEPILLVSQVRHLLQHFFVRGNWQPETSVQKQVQEILSLRRILYKKYYHNPKTKQLGYVFLTILKLVDKKTHFSHYACLNTPTRIINYLKLTDDILTLIARNNDLSLRKARDKARKLLSKGYNSS